jgi:hypothetical protein
MQNTLDRWEQRITADISCSDPALCNLKVTLAHYELSRALDEVLGYDSGPNFHTWAVWGSKKAGTTIRREDVPSLLPLSAVGGGVLGWLLAALVSGRRRRAAVGLPAALLGGLGFYALAAWGLRNASEKILAGNVTVLDDIGRVSARFICTFAEHSWRDAERLDTFLSTLRPGPASEGGQDLLKAAFTEYYRARHEHDPDARDERMLLGNLYAILHEHFRLQPYIGGAMPWPIRRLVTASLLNFHIGLNELTVSRDVPAWRAQADPGTLRQLENPDLVRFLMGHAENEGWDRTPESLLESRADDWTDIRDRMNYICDLFRERYFDPELYAAPFTEEQCACILEGRMPARPY